MTDSRPMTRRQVLKATLGVAGLAAGGRLLAAQPGVTPRQTEGPFFPTRDRADKDIDLTWIEGHAERALGEVIDVSGQVLAEDGTPLAGARVDVWHANHHGRYDHDRDPNPAPLDPNFQGWARFTTDAEGRYRFRTIKPGAYKVEGSWTRPPHIHFKVAQRGFHELTTQMYFAGHPLNDADRLLLEVPEDERGRLIVEFSGRSADPETPPHGHFDIVLRRVAPVPGRG
jgi:protocatechuate 3,4-dioxygenase, beta subunit